MMPDSGDVDKAFGRFLKVPTDSNRTLLDEALIEYRELWITSRSLPKLFPSFSEINGPRRHYSYESQRRHASYDLEIVAEEINHDGIPLRLALQMRSGKGIDNPYWQISWRTLYKNGGTNRRFYKTKNGYVVAPVSTALTLINNLKDRNAFTEKYADNRLGSQSEFDVLVSADMSASEREQWLVNITDPNEDWGSMPYFVIVSDPHPDWRKVFICNTETRFMTFRSIVRKSNSYMPKIMLRDNCDWWLDNSMMDASVHQMGVFHQHLLNLNETSTMLKP
jgi:hypothetical protein